jgi:hypothetical protein
MVAVRTLAIAGLIALVADAGMAQAGFKDGNSLLTECRETESRPSDQYYQRGFCLGYIEGIADYLELVRETSGLKPCVPSGATAGQIKDVVINALMTQPADRNIDAALLAMNAISKAWHCQGR